MVKFKKYILMLTLTLSVLGWVFPDLQVSAAPAGHVHEWGSYSWMVKPYFVVSRAYLYTYESNGCIYDLYEVTEYGEYYRECYCGEREYSVGGVSRKVRILVE